MLPAYFLRMFARWLPDAFIELLARLAGYTARQLFDKGFSAERLIRGALIGARFGAKRLRLGRQVQFEGASQITLGDEVTFYMGTQLVACRTGEIRIGSHTHIGGHSLLSGQGGIEIGSRCAISSGVAIYSISNQYQESPEDNIIDNKVVYGKVTIGDDVWLGAGAIIFPGVTIGDHAVVGAGSVVRTDVSPWQVVAGVPARFLKDRRMPIIGVTRQAS